MTDAERMKNYEQSYKSMWDDIGRARRDRDNALKAVDGARDLIMSLRHDMGDETTKVSLRTMDALNKLQSRLSDFD